MPKVSKRKRSRSDSEDFGSFAKKLKKLVDSVDESPPRRRRRRLIIESSSSSSRESSPTPPPENREDGEKADSRNPENGSQADNDALEIAAEGILEAGTSDAGATLDDAVLEILGEDPTSTIEYGKEVHVQLANRFEHIATTGLAKEARKELCSKYLIPSNCTHIAAPKLNAEIKAALNENLVKRDKAIEIRQKQLAAAISCVAEIATEQLQSKDVNHNVLKKAMDAGRLLSDIQHSDSVTRRIFATNALKKEIKEHLFNAKIDKFLFGESLPDALKTAKAVSKSGTDLKVEVKKKVPAPAPPRTQATAKRPAPAARNLNWKPTAPARRQPEPLRNREPAAPRAPHETSYRQSPYPQRFTRHR